jgi:tetratricopeptide (TPR) repeat protein
MIDPEILDQYQHALSLMADEKFSHAEKILQKIIDSHPELAGPYVNIGIIDLKTDKTSEAEHAFKQAIEHSPDNVIARNQLGILYRKSGRFDEALQMYNKALEIDPQYANAHLNLGILYDLYLNKPEMALTQYQRYLDLINEEDKQVELWIADIKNRIKQPPPQTAENQP